MADSGYVYMVFYIVGLYSTYAENTHINPANASQVIPTYVTSVQNVSITSTTTVTTPGPCVDQVCENNGQCLDGFCTCPSGFKGDRCQEAGQFSPSTQSNTVLSGTNSATPTSPTTHLPSLNSPNSNASSTLSSHMTPDPANIQRALPVNSNVNLNKTGNVTDSSSNKTGSDVTTVFISPCSRKPCLNNAICQDEADTFVCVCHHDFTGLFCETVICSEEYLAAPAHGNKSCSTQPHSLSDITCDVICQTGYYFIDGQKQHVYDCTDGLWLPSEKDVADCIRVNYCQNVTCQNGGSCYEGWKTSSCGCASGYTGDSCEIDIDECTSSPCENGGSCTDGSNMFTCLCPAGYGGYTCQTEILEIPVLTSVFPEYGPQSGGTRITVTGDNLIVPALNIIMYLSDLKVSAETIEQKLSKVVESNSTHVIALTPRADDDMIRRYFPLGVEISGGNVYRSQLYFKYKPNPHILDIQPMDTIIDGGTSLTINGTSLDAVAVPMVRVTMVTTWRASGLVTKNNTEVFTEPCDESNNKTQRICRMPRINITAETLKYVLPPADRRRKSRQIQSMINTGTAHVNSARARRAVRRELQSGYTGNSRTVEFYLGFEFDGMETYLNISSVGGLQDLGLLSVYPGPVITPRTTPIIFKDLGQGPMYINGSGLVRGIRKQDYRVTVGSATCDILDLSDVALVCQPPSEQPDSDDKEDPIITIYVGSNMEIRYGTLRYPSSFWIIAGPVIGAAFVLLAILIALILLRQKIRARHGTRKHQKKTYLYSPNEMIKMPASTEENGRNDDGSGSLLVFQDPNLSDYVRRSPVPSRGSSQDTLSADDSDFDPPEEFYENKETIVNEMAKGKKQKRTPNSVQKYADEPHRNSVDPTLVSPKRMDKIPTVQPEPQLGTFNVRKKEKPSLYLKIDNGNRTRTPSSGTPQEEMYINNFDPKDNQELYENTVRGKKRETNSLPRRAPSALPEIPVNNQATPPPVPDTPRPKLEITPKYGRHKYKHREYHDENPFNKRGNSEDDDIYINSPIKARGIRSSWRGSRGHRGRAKRLNSATMWF